MAGNRSAPPGIAVTRPAAPGTDRVGGTRAGHGDAAVGL